MKKMYLKIELIFERLTSTVTRILGNAITFTIAFIMVIYWWATNLFKSNDSHQNIGDIIFGITFLSLFIIQKSFNKYSALIHLKMNELISSHEHADNSVINTTQKTEKEIRELAEQYLDEEIEEVIKEIIKEDTSENQI